MLKNKYKNKNISGFTLIELLVVIVVIGILISIVGIGYRGWDTKLAITQLKSDLSAVGTIMEDVRNFGEGYPVTIPSNFTPSDGITLAGGGTSDGNSYCIEAYFAEYSLYYSISSTNGSKAVISEGVCGPTVFVATAVSGTRIDLSWNSKSGATSYTIEYDDNSNFSSPSWFYTGNGSSASHVGLTPMIEYYYRIKAVTPNGDSAWSVTSATTLSYITPPSTPQLTVALSGSNVVATVTPLSCSVGTIQYSFQNKVNNDGSWSSFSAWSSTNTASQVANDGYKYTYKARARCYSDSTIYSSYVNSVEVSYTDPLSTPSVPVVAVNTALDISTWSWPTVSCATGSSPSYQYKYTISPSGYDSGWKATSNTSVTFTTSTSGQTYAVSVQAKCFNSNTSSGWSGSGSASYFRQLGALSYIGFVYADAGGVSPVGKGSDTLVMSSDGLSVYVNNNRSHNISMFSRDTETGLLTLLGIVTSGQYPRGLAISPDDKFVYSSDSASNSITRYSRDTTTGMLTKLGGTPVVGNSPRDIAISPDGATLYVADSYSDDLDMFSRDISTGALTSKGTRSPGSAPECIKVSPAGDYAYVSNYSSNNIAMYSRNTSTGSLYSLKPATIATGTGPWGIAISPDGASVYAINKDSSTISMYSRSSSTGLLSTLSPVSVVTGAEGFHIAISADGYSVYATSGAEDALYMYDRNISTGVLTQMSPTSIATGNHPDFVLISPDDRFVYVANDNNGAQGSITIYSRNS
ncbi:MAG TPA: beta-propeller fold lactonase family protein [Candidatus Saccharibacteria bacterium]|nr:beta-propeller fold lactonase family protein [Candidatus Saccharibacteria bacterium]